MEIGIAFDLRSDFGDLVGGPEDRLEEYDSDHTVSAIEAAIAGLGHSPRRLGGGRRLLEEVLRRPPDLVFNFAEGFGSRSREAHVPSVLEMLGIPCSHSDPLTCALTLDKAMAKKVAAAGGVPTPRWDVVSSAAAARETGLAFPIIAKPSCEGSSMGIRKSSRVASPAALGALVDKLLDDYGQPVLLEEFASGAELTVGIVGNGADTRVIGVMEIAPRVDLPEEFVYSLEVKRDYENQVAYHVPPRLPRAVVAGVERVALDAYRELGCRDVSRVDVRLTGDGLPMFLEVNPLPGLNPTTGDIVILSERAGLDYRGLIASILDAARKRYDM